MTALIGEVTRRLPDRWLGQTLGPGLLLVAAGWAAVRLGHRRPFAFDAVAAEGQRLAQLAKDRPVVVVLGGLAVVGLAVLVSMVARGMGSAVRMVWLGRWGAARRVAAGVARLRARRATRRLAKAHTRLPAPYLPATPTWIGDRLRLTDARITAQYGLSLGLVWPRLWQLIDTDTRVLVQEARTRFDRTTVLAGWACWYALLAIVWWPSAVLAVGVLAVAWRRGRVAAALFSDTVESTVDLQHRRLAEALGYPVDEGKALTPAVADAINDQLHKGATPQPRAE